MKQFRRLLPLLLLSMTLIACQSKDALSTPVARVAGPTLYPTPTLLTSLSTPEGNEANATNDGTLAPSPAPQQTTAAEATLAHTGWKVAVDPSVPLAIREAVQQFIEAQRGQFRWAEGETADVRLVLNEGNPLATWVYAVAVPFATLDDATTLANLQQNWQTGAVPTAIMTEDVAALLTKLWGAGQGQAVAEGDLVTQIWAQRPTWTLVPFDRLSPELKVLVVDGMSPVAPQFDPNAYPLTMHIGLVGDEAAIEAFSAAWTGPKSNYRPSRITHVAMTGVTALVRATAYQMEIRGLNYPGEEVAPVLQAADIAHISNEVSFVADCPPPHYVGDPVFCSHPRYLELLKAIGVDVVELTGNHLNDWGAQYLPYTLDLYDEAGMRYFGGGRDLAAAREPLLVEHNGNHIAFVGCNPVGPYGGWAAEQRAGAQPCDYEAFKAQITQLKQDDYVVIATQQYQEIYHYGPTDQQRADFRTLAEAGAAAVSGSQGHHAQGFDFHANAFIHYGLGNLFFDQMNMMGTRQTFVDTYTIYEGRLLNVELWTGLIENYARPRLMTLEERRLLLQTVFEASGW